MQHFRPFGRSFRVLREGSPASLHWHDDMDPPQTALELAPQIVHLLRERGESRPIPVIGGFVVRPRADGGVTVLWHAPGPVTVSALRTRSLRRYQQVLSGLGMVTVLQTNVAEPYLACWMPGQRKRVTLRVRVAAAFGSPTGPARRAAS